MKIRRKVHRKLEAALFEGGSEGADKVAKELDLYQDHWKYLEGTDSFLCRNFGEVPVAAPAGDWIIKFEDGKVRSCSPENFKLDYEEVI